jgi:hypothetical protein
MITPGLYKHYKGSHYRVLFIAKNSNNGPDEDENVVVYVSLSEPGRISVRSESQFEEKVVEAKFPPLPPVKRFERVGD